VLSILANLWTDGLDMEETVGGLDLRINVSMTQQRQKQVPVCWYVEFNDSMTWGHWNPLDIKDSTARNIPYCGATNTAMVHSRDASPLDASHQVIVDASDTDVLSNEACGFGFGSTISTHTVMSLIPGSHSNLLASVGRMVILVLLLLLISRCEDKCGVW